MKNVLILELKLLFQRREFKVVLNVVLFISVWAFLFFCFNWFGADIREVRAAHEHWMGLCPYGRNFGMLLFMILPLVASIPYADTYYIDCVSGIHKNILTKTDRKTYFFAKAIVVFISGFIVIFLPLILNQLLVLTVAPLHSEATRFGFPSFQFTAERHFIQRVLFPRLILNHRYLYNFVYMLIPSLFAGLFALLSYSISFITKKSRLLILVLPFVVHNITSLVLAVFGRSYLSASAHFSAGSGLGGRSVQWLITLLLFYFITSILIIILRNVFIKDEL